MKATDMISKIAKFMDSDKEVFIHIYTRDSDNCVTGTEVYPLEAVFAHEYDSVKLCIESSRVLTKE